MPLVVVVLKALTVSSYQCCDDVCVWSVGLTRAGGGGTEGFDCLVVSVEILLLATPRRGC